MKLIPRFLAYLLFFLSRFQVNVQFCVDECNPVDCDGITSYGRRKRDVAAVATLAPRTTTVPEPYASRLVYDPTLGQVCSHVVHMYTARSIIPYRPLEYCTIGNYETGCIYDPTLVYCLGFDQMHGQIKKRNTKIKMF